MTSNKTELEKIKSFAFKMRNHSSCIFIIKAIIMVSKGIIPHSNFKNVGTSSFGKTVQTNKATKNTIKVILPKKRYFLASPKLTSQRTQTS